ncbi:MAG TPA: MFS transporter [Caulobacteraceae bacterium]|nr:MFS transporter [Caulobacteraceae bacterium]
MSEATLETASTLETTTDEPQTPEEAEAAYERFVWANLPRNFAGHFIHGMLGMTGFRLFNAPTFLPAYLHLLSGSDFIVGLGQSLQQLGGVISPVIGATQIEHRKKVLPVAILMGTLMRIQILGVAVAGFLLHGYPLLIAILAFLFLLGLFSGPQSVAFQLLLAKVIPIARRGRLQALRNVTGGAIAAGLAWFAGRYLIQRNVFGNGYGVTFLLAFVLTSLGLSALQMLMREPEPPTVRSKSRVMDRVREFPALFRQDRGFLFFMVAQTLATAGRVAAPFYILYAGHSMQLNGKNLGLLSLAFLGADTVTNLGWGLAGDRFGFRFTFVLALIVWIGGTVLLMAAPSLVSVHLPGSGGGPHGGVMLGAQAFILMAFFALGAAQSGFLMSSQTMVLEFGTRDDIPMRLALTTTAQGAMNTIGPLAGGLIATTLGYQVLFGVSMGLLAIALAVLLVLVEEPRNRPLASGRSRMLRP